MGLVLIPLMAFLYWRENRRRDAMQRRAEETGMKVDYTAEELRILGARAPTFRYTL